MFAVAGVVVAKECTGVVASNGVHVGRLAGEWDREGCGPGCSSVDPSHVLLVIDVGAESVKKSLSELSAYAGLFNALDLWEVIEMVHAHGFCGILNNTNVVGVHLGQKPS